MLTKKAQESTSYIMFVIAIVIAIFVFSLGLFTSFLIQNKMRMNIHESMENVMSDFLLLDILHAPVNDEIMADIVVRSYTNNNYDELTAQLQELLKTYIGEKTDWEIFIENKKMKDNCGFFGCRGKKYTYETILPLMNANDKKNIRVVLNIYTQNAD